MLRLSKGPLILLFLLLYMLHSGQGQAQESDSLKGGIRYGKKGFELFTANRNYLLHIELRLQTRIAYPFESDPITFEDLEDETVFIGINRARIKMGGHAFRPYFKFYFEHEVFAGKLLDYRIMFEKIRAFNFKIGQWKVQYNRERIISSGKQQTVDRSILTFAFTVDRQQGLSFYGSFGQGAANFNYWVSAFMGTGRGATSNDDEHLMYMGRLQWNPSGHPVPFTGSDLDLNRQFLFSLALAAVTNRSPFTRFSTDGGGQLPGFEEGAAGQYRIHQWLVETAGMHRGFSWQQEFHGKYIDDKVKNVTTLLIGNLIQFGYFFHAIAERFPRQLEFFVRHAIYDPDTNIDNNFRSEFTLGANWFFNKHRNKLTLGYNFLQFQDSPENLQDGSRVRLQWDVSF